MVNIKQQFPYIQLHLFAIAMVRVAAFFWLTCRYLACWFFLRQPGTSLKVSVIGQS